MRLLSVLLTWVQLCLSSQHVHTVNKFILPLNQPPRPLWASPGQDPGLGWLVPFTLPWPSAWHSGMYVGWRCVLIFYIKQYMLIVEDPDNRIALNNPTPPGPMPFPEETIQCGILVRCWPAFPQWLAVYPRLEMKVVHSYPGFILSHGVTSAELYWSNTQVLPRFQERMRKPR